jgi:hypothetical protein
MEMKVVATFLLAFLLAFSTQAQCTKNVDGSSSCKLSLADGTVFSYQSFTNVIYPLGLSCDPLVGIIYTLRPPTSDLNAVVYDQDWIRIPSGCVVDIQSGRISCGPVNQKATATFSITIN